MTKRNRDTLKTFFKKGSLPSEDQFHDLIDSALNTIDEGFNKAPEYGFEISSLGSYDRLLSFCRNNDRPLWLVSYDRDQDKLLFKNAREEVVLSLSPDGHVGVNNKDPEWPLDVGGVIRAEGRIGVLLTKEKSIPADGRWHDISPDLSGCQAFEVMAGAGKKKSGKYALMHAFALNTYHPKGFFFNFLNFKNRIKYHQAYYRSFSDRLKLRWSGENRKYTLQLRSNSDYGDGTRIKYYLTRLWFDEAMDESAPLPDGGG